VLYDQITRAYDNGGGARTGSIEYLWFGSEDVPGDSCRPTKYGYSAGTASLAELCKLPKLCVDQIADAVAALSRWSTVM